jgi:hypothetical protein
MRQLSDEGAYSIGEPCPFAAGGYQVMRNIAAEAALTIPGSSEWRVLRADAPLLNCHERRKGGGFSVESL